MKRWIAALMSVLMMLALAACASAPETTVPKDAYDLAYNMADYDWFRTFLKKRLPRNGMPWARTPFCWRALIPPCLWT